MTNYRDIYKNSPDLLYTWIFIWIFQIVYIHRKKPSITILVYPVYTYMENIRKQLQYMCFLFNTCIDKKKKKEIWQDRKKEPLVKCQEGGGPSEI